MNAIRTVCAVIVLAVLGGCRGEPSRQPPIHLNPNMDTQDKYKAYRGSDFFEDGRAMRPPPAGTVARGLLAEDDAYDHGREATGGYVGDFPVKVDEAMVRRGQERYNIYCAPCHDHAGTGKGTVTMIQPGLVPIPSYHEDRIRQMSVGELFNVITNGVRTMPPYAHQLPVKDRWAVVAYVRALQLSQRGAE